MKTDHHHPHKTPLEKAERRVLKALTVQTKNLEQYPNTPHTGETQQTIMTTLEILSSIGYLKEKDNGNSQDQDPDR